MEAYSSLKRRNSLPSAVIIHHLQVPAPFSTAGLELLPLPSAAYTSLKDLLPPSPSLLLSPTPSAAVFSCPSNGGSGYEISIRNRLVKQAAWAYLHPAASSSPSSSRRLCFSGQFLRRYFAGFPKFLVNSLTSFYGWLVDALWLVLCR